MRKNFNKIMACVLSATMAFSMAVALPKNVRADGKADLAKITLSGVEFEPIVESYEGNDEGILTGNTILANERGGFTADLQWGTGWQRLWTGQNQPTDAWGIKGGWCDNPNQIRTEATIKANQKTSWQLSFILVNNMQAGGNPTEKNVTITVNSGIDGDNDNVWLNKTITVPKNGTKRVSETFTIPEGYTAGTAHITIAFGCYAYSYEANNDFPFYKLMPTTVISKYMFAPGTTEAPSATGTLEFNSFSLKQIAYIAPVTDTVTTPVVKKPAKAKISSAKNVKTKKITVKWKKVTGATKYQVRTVLGKKTVKKTTTKTTYTFKKLKKNKTYKVSVRAYNSAGYGAWSTAKKVKITK